MNRRVRNLAEQLDAGLIARREFLRNAAVITGGTAAGLQALKGMAGAQSPTKLRVWLFKSFVTAGNDVLEKQIQNWAKDRKVTAEIDWATFGDREQKFVAAIEAGNPPDIAEMQILGPMRYKPALRDVTQGGERHRRSARGHAALRRQGHEAGRQVLRRAAVFDDDGLLHPQRHHGGQGAQAAHGL